jgi:hypothetical protein
LGDFEEADIDRVEKAYFTSDEEFARLVAEGRLKPENLEHAKAAEDKHREKLFEAATQCVYQLSNCGVRRKFHCYDDTNLYNAVWNFVECDDGDDDESLPDMIRFALEGSHRILFINRLGFDYISLPSRILKQAWLDAREKEIDSFDSELQAATKLVISNDPGGKKTRRRKTRKLKLVPPSQLDA